MRPLRSIVSIIIFLIVVGGLGYTMRGGFGSLFGAWTNGGAIGTLQPYAPTTSTIHMEDRPATKHRTTPKSTTRPAPTTTHRSHTARPTSAPTARPAPAPDLSGLEPQVQAWLQGRPVACQTFPLETSNKPALKRLGTSDSGLPEAWRTVLLEWAGIVASDDVPKVYAVVHTYDPDTGDSWPCGSAEPTPGDKLHWSSQPGVSETTQAIVVFTEVGNQWTPHSALLPNGKALFGPTMATN